MAVHSPHDRSSLMRVDQVGRLEWEALVEQHADAVIDQTWAFGEACWGRDRLSHLVVLDGADVVGVCQVVLLRLPVLRGGIAHVKFGPLSRPGGEDDRARRRLMLAALREEYVVKRRMLLRVMPQPVPACDASVDEDLRAVGFVREPISDALRYVVDLSPSEEQRRASLKSKWRYHLKRAEKTDLFVERADATAGVETFLTLYAAMREQKEFADDRALRRLSDIVDLLPDSMKPMVWLCRQGGQSVAAAVVTRLGESAHYLFGASNLLGRDARAGYLLHWHICTALRAAGCRWYDLGGATGSAGLEQFKSGLVGKQVTPMRLPGNYDLSPGGMSAFAARIALRLRDARVNRRSNSTATGMRDK